MLKTPGVMESTTMYRYYESIGLEHANLFALELCRVTIDGLDGLVATRLLFAAYFDSIIA